MQHRPAVPDHDRIEAVHQRDRVPRVAQREVELLAQPRGQEHVLVAVPPALRRIGEIGDEQNPGTLAHHGRPRRWGSGHSTRTGPAGLRPGRRAVRRRDRPRGG
ncbi:hypothetical protein KCH_00710 [Kitasatospora cheerisanensis KCTC 2395]|uniref:Uncharacterized protein n=1 Tax=Kitasatospora cheerisanensis KCTC 2395 TaxID=1348663 RepID=A0A066ZD31_9ACTN|nr:hypothetical protein KCH_00710 [Kitasatospora cheerisanensis KCTC 2395]